MATEQQLPPERLKELATAAIAKRTQAGRKSGERSASRGKAHKPSVAMQAALGGLLKDLSEFYGYKAVPRTNKEHALMAEIVAETWVPIEDYEREVRYKEEAQERISELSAENADLRRRIEQRIQEVPRLRAIMRAALARLIVDSGEKHVREDWAVLLLKHIESARDLLAAEISSIDNRI